VSATAHCNGQVSSTRGLEALTGNFARQTEETRTVNCGNELRKRSDRNADALLNELNIERITAKDANADYSAASAIGTELQNPTTSGESRQATRSYPARHQEKGARAVQNRAAPRQRSL